VLRVALELSRELIPRSSRSRPERTAALRHEAGDDAVEREVVVEPELREVQEARGVHGRHVGQEADLDRPLARLHPHGVRSPGIEGRLLGLRQARAPAGLARVGLRLFQKLFDLHGRDSFLEDVT
jgi:hypothetical protein